jgi:hypothetical protein
VIIAVDFSLIPIPSAADDVDGIVPVECTPASGSIFPIGSTTVECTATDAAGNIGRASFTVTIRPAPEEIAVFFQVWLAQSQNPSSLLI